MVSGQGAPPDGSDIFTGLEINVKICMTSKCN